MAKPKTKEQVYDEQINPLMTQILAICKDRKIAMVAAFHIPNEDDPDLVCTSALTTDEYEPPEEFLDIVRDIYQKPVMLAITVTTPKAP